ncbi:MAG: hypothetical protein WDZ27_03245 [Waddliaceae bacterium]
MTLCTLLFFTGCTMQPIDEYSVIPMTNNPDFCGSGYEPSIPGAQY